MRIAVVGAGYLGASFAYHAAELGADVVVFDTTGVGQGASGSTFACLNAFGHSDADFTAFRHQAIRYLCDLAPRIGGEQHVYIGATTRFGDDRTFASLLQKAERYEAMGLPVKYLDRKALATSYPYLKADGIGEFVIEVPGEGWADIQALARIMLEHPRIELRRNESIVDFTWKRGWKVISQRSRIDADAIVIAAGIGSPEIAARIGARVEVRKIPGMMLRLFETKPLVSSVIYGPSIHFHGFHQKHIIAGIDDGDDEGEPSLDMISKRATICLERLQQWMPSIQFEASEAVLGTRPVPPDGLPIMGQLDPHESAYILVAHGGATMGARLGSLLAQQVVLGKSNEVLMKFYPGRFEPARSHA